MRSRMLTLAALAAIGLLLSSIPAAAQSQITLGGSRGLLTFSGLGSGSPNTLSLNFGSCKSGICALGGTASGTGALASGPSPYQFINTQGAITLTLANAALGQWDVLQTSATVFNYGTNGSLLSGTLDLLNFVQSPGTKGGMFNYTGNANLTISGGSLASAFTSSNGILDLTIFFRSATNIESLLGNSGRIGSQISSGNVLPAPEPSSILMLGSGLMLAGGMLRSKLRNNRSGNEQNRA